MNNIIGNHFKMFQFNKNYFLPFLFIFLIELLIALFVIDNFIRPYLGDVLVVILLYCFVRSFTRLSGFFAAIGVLVFSFLIEFLKYRNLVQRLDLEESVIARAVLGTSFEWLDLAAYLIGVFIIYFIELIIRKQRIRPVLK